MKFSQVLVVILFILPLSITRADDEDEKERKRIEAYQLNLLKHSLDATEHELESKHYGEAVNRILRVEPNT